MMDLMLCLLLLMTALMVVSTHNNLWLIIYFSAFSFIAASIYFISKAPDLALAEIAVGCAFIPLVYTIAISKQNTFSIVFYSGSLATCPDKEAFESNLNTLINRFAKHYHLKLDQKNIDASKLYTSKNLIHPGKIDLIVYYDTDRNCLLLKGLLSNMMLNTLEQMNHDSTIQIVRVSDYGEEI